MRHNALREPDDARDRDGPAAALKLSDDGLALRDDHRPVEFVRVALAVVECDLVHRIEALPSPNETGRRILPFRRPFRDAPRLKRKHEMTYTLVTPSLPTGFNQDNMGART